MENRDIRSIDERLRVALVAQLFNQVRPGMLWSLFAAFFLAVCLWGEVDHRKIATWLTLFVLVQIPRHVLVGRFHKVQPQGRAVLWWGMLFSAGAVATALLWGFSAVFLFPEHSVFHQYLILIFVCGVALSTATAHSPLSSSYVPSILCALLPVSARFLYEGEIQHGAIGIGSLIVAFVLLLTCGRINRLFSKSVALGIERNELIQSLTEEKARAQDLAASLTVEIDKKRNAEQSLQTAHHDLEKRVRERTEDLTHANEELKREIQERQRAEDALVESEKRYRRLFEQSRDAIYFSSRDGTLLEANRAVFTLFGYDADELIGDDIRKLYLNPEDRPAFQDAIEARGSVMNYEVKFKKRDGTPLDCLLTSSVRTDANGTVTGYEGIIRDVTELKRATEDLKQSKETLEATLNATTDFAFLLDREGRFLALNKRTAEERGSSVDELIGRSAFDDLPDSVRRTRWNRFKEVLASSQAVRFEDSRNGRNYRISYFPIQDKDGLVSRVAVFSADVSRQKVAEKALRQSEEKYRTIFEHTLLGILHFDPEGTITAVNENVGRIMNCSSEPLKDLSITRDVPDLRIREAAQKALDGKVGQCEGQDLRLTDNASSSAGISFSPVLDENGRVTAGIAIVVDISKRVQAEAKLARTEVRCRQLIEQATDLVWLTDRHGRFTMVNPILLKITGFTEDEVIGKPYLDFIPKEYKKRVERFYSVQFLKKRPTSYYEFPILTKAGEWIWIGEHAQLVTEGDDVVGFQAIARDITDRKLSEEALRQSQEKYRAIIESIDEGYYETDLKGNLTFFNESLCRILGYSHEELSGMSYAKFMDASDAHETYRVFMQVFETGKPGGMFQWELISKDGARRSIEASVSLIRDAEGQKLGYRGLCRDITERKQAEELIVRSERLQAVAELATGVAHNFNNLLQLVLGCANTAMSALRAHKIDEATRHLTRIAESSELGAETVRRLQDFGRVRAKSGDEDSQVFDLSETVEQAVRMSDPWWKTNPEREGIRIELQRHMEPGCTVMGNRYEMFGVALNLIKNAAEALPEGGAIGVSTCCENTHVVLRVTDSGIGIPKEDMVRVFEPFWTTKGYHGTGMGLATSFGVVKRHGGEIFLDSRERAGTTVTVRLPRAEPLPAEVTTIENEQPGAAFRLLIVDDMKPFLETLQEGLQELGHSVHAAGCGEKALELIRRQSFDAVVCDLGMPGMNGWQVAGAVKAISLKKGEPKVPFILLTGWGGQIEEQEKIAKCGVDRVVEKPVDLMRLVQTVREVIGDEHVPLES